MELTLSRESENYSPSYPGPTSTPAGELAEGRLRPSAPCLQGALASLGHPCERKT